MIFLSGILLLIAGLSEAVMDTLAHHFEESGFSRFNPKFWDPKISGSNKWKGDNRLSGEKFLFSSTLLVGFTEGWHLAKMIRTITLFVGIAILVDMLGVLIGVLLSMTFFKVYFTIFYMGFRK